MKLVVPFLPPTIFKRRLRPYLYGIKLGTYDTKYYKIDTELLTSNFLNLKREFTAYFYHPFSNEGNKIWENTIKKSQNCIVSCFYNINTGEAIFTNVSIANFLHNLKTKNNFYIK